MVKFLHTSDWQLGMRRNYLDETAQSRFSDERFAAIRRMSKLAVDENCAFVIVAGDVFETNQPTRETLIRAFDAMSSEEIDFYLLPGNHDALEPGSIYRSASFLANCPPNVKVLDRAGRFELSDQIEIIAAPLTSKRPLSDQIADTCDSLETSTTIIRICVAHGQVDEIMGIDDNPALFNLANANALITNNQLAYIALGDSHSVAELGPSGRIWYSGAHVATSRREPKPNHVLIVDATNQGCKVEEREIGNWHFVSESRRLDTAEEVEELDKWLGGIPDKETTVVRLELEGVLNVESYDRLQQVLQDYDLLFAALRLPDEQQDIQTQPTPGDFESLELSGFAREALEDLSVSAVSGSEDAKIATDALALLYRFGHTEV